MSTLHLVVVADTRDASIGSSVEVDIERMQKSFVDYSTQADMWFSMRILRDDHFEHNTVIQNIQNFAVNTDDVIVFYYTGHGFRNASKLDPWPLMAMGFNEHGQVRGFDVKWIYHMMLQKNPRLLLMITDSCQEEVDDYRSDILQPSLSRGGLNRAQNCKTLFRQAQGDALFISCQPGEYSYCDTERGGFFTHRLMTCIESALGEANPSWSQIAEEAILLDHDAQNPMCRVLSSPEERLRNLENPNEIQNWTKSPRSASASRSAAQPSAHFSTATAQRRTLSSAAPSRGSSTRSPAQSDGKICGKCGHSNGARSKFCRGCGSILS